jgi:pyruvate,water dikinase
MDKHKSLDGIVRALQERAKELNCLYKIVELINQPKITLEEIFYGVIEAIPEGWQFPDYCHSRIIYDNREYEGEEFYVTPWMQSTPITLEEEILGYIEVYYTEEMPEEDEGPFLKEERKLIDTISDRLGHFILHNKLKTVFNEWKAKTSSNGKYKPEWLVVLDLLRRTDQPLFSIISRKMINHLFTKGYEGSKVLFEKLGTMSEEEATMTEVNRPTKRQVLDRSFTLADDAFQLASKYLDDVVILSMIQRWINEEKSHFLVRALSNPNTTLSEIADAVRRYYHINPTSDERSSPVSKGIRVSLIRRFLTDQLEFINIAKNYCNVQDFYRLLNKMIFPSDSYGKLGGKSAGLFLAKKIIESREFYNPSLANIKTPKTWYITSDGTVNFIYHNNLEDIIEQKYKDIDDIRKEYSHLIQAFKNSQFPTEIMNGLSRALDDFGDTPIIVRSSSLLEDRMGASFAGKYKSLFLANQGTKQEKLEALMDAIAEVYASTFGPDPVGYRIERGLLDFNEEMAIMIQEVVGVKVGHYFFPAFAGVAFSNNEFRWSPRIKREDGLIRIVPGLGTRAVDRVGDDYPILVAPGQPDLRVNLSFQDVVGYAPKSVDMINLKTNTFDTISMKQLIEEVGNDYPMINEVFSIQEEHHLKKPVGLGIDTRKHHIVPTFDNLISKKHYIEQIHSVLTILKEKLKSPVDIEFACNGKDLYLLQCRPQSMTKENISANIPKDISPKKVLFTANRFVSNGRIPDVNYIVYVDPDEYSKIQELKDLKEIGVVVSKLNKLLPKKNFILMGPGRWGSRGDIRLGVSVTYADINNTSLLIEIARKKGNYIPDLSFGTHFFQDLVEASIRYLPLYPDDKDIKFKESFFRDSENILTRFLPDHEHLSKVIKVINVREATRGLVLRVLMNADKDEAMALFTDPKSTVSYNSSGISKDTPQYDEPWEIRTQTAEYIASKIDANKFGVKDVYLFGTTYHKTATASSDVDLLIHFAGNEEQKRMLTHWLDGWSQALTEFNYNQFGYRIEPFLDVTFITDDELKEKDYYVEMLDLSKDLAKKLKIMR